MQKKIDEKEFEKFQNSLFDLLLIENNILRKKERQEKLTKQEQFFDLFPSPSFIIKILYKGDIFDNENKK